MFRFWDLVIAPVIEAAAPRRVVEIGALRGENTELMLDRLGPDVELHVIDPVPAFDPSEHERRFRGRYVFHRDTSHNVLPGLGPVDVAIVDGDHNWFTVFRELEMLEATAAAAGEPLPLLLLHDVLWPYGRRDLYYAPERIPEEHRQPYARRGMVPGSAELVPRGGLNPTLDNAQREGGPRNGVMTGLDDFVRASARNFRTVLVPIHFGLAIVVDQERLARTPALAAALDGVESADGRYRQLELAESIALDDLVFQHNLFFAGEHRAEAAAERYLGLLKGGLLDEHALENEVRIEYLRRCAERNEVPDPSKLHDPARFLPALSREFELARRAGSGSAGGRPVFAATAMGRHRLEHLEQCLDVVRRENVAGDLVECGTGRGGGAIFMRGFLAAHEIARTRVWVADPFVGLADTGRASPERADLNIVRDTFARFDLLDDRVRFLQGETSAALPDAPIEQVALLRLDTGSAASTRAALAVLYDRVTVGGFIVVDGHDDPDTRRAVEEFRAERGIEETLEQVDFAAAGWRKLRQASEPGTVPVGDGRHAPLAPPLPRERVELSVVVVFYNMRREAERTLRSLTRAYQEEVDDLDYEVVVVENGSCEEQKLGDDFVRSFGPEFRYLDLGDTATPSPAPALNRGIEIARGRSLALMIDGAHVLTPGVLRFGALGLRAHEPAVVAVQQWYVGPGQQPDVVANGYDVEYEDRLFEGIEWPTDGYRLFEVGHFIGERDWFDFLWESNCLFVPRRILEQVGGFDESFSVPGGGFANFDLFERVAASPDVTLVTMLGEGSFHQVHGGTTTNASDADLRNATLAEYGAHYVEHRGRIFRGPSSRIHFVGTMFGDACRTRARHLTSPELWKRGKRIDLDGRPTQPVPMPDALKAGFVDAFWSSFAWQETSWLGRRVAKCPTDLLAYQELVVRVRPDWIVETGTGDGGRALFLASICDLIGHGQVLCLDEKATQVPPHPRITHLARNPLAAETITEVRALVGPDPNALLILGLARKRPLLAAFRAYAPLVPVGSYVVFEDTITNGNPVWAGMGPGPREAVQDLAKERLTGAVEFVADREPERFGLTFNPGGFLRRVG